MLSKPTTFWHVSPRWDAERRLESEREVKGYERRVAWMDGYFSWGRTLEEEDESNERPWNRVKRGSSKVQCSDFIQPFIIPENVFSYYFQNLNTLSKFTVFLLHRYGNVCVWTFCVGACSWACLCLWKRKWKSVCVCVFSGLLSTVLLLPPSVVQTWQSAQGVWALSGEVG